MSAPNWLGDGQSLHNGENGAFPMSNDPMMGFMQPNNPSSFDFTASQQQQMQQRMPNGNPINGSPASLNAMYQTSSTIPSKRPRPREDSVGGSPQLFPGSLPASRSQTPHGPYPGFGGPVNGVFPGHPAYQNLQTNTPGPNQSPLPQAQPFQPPNTQQAPFSPAPQKFAGQGSPPHSEGSSRVNTPQNGATNYPPNMQYGMGPNPAYPAQAVAAVNGVPNAPYGQFPHEQQMLRQANTIAAMRANANGPGMPMNHPGQLPNQLSNVQMGQLRAQQAQQGAPRATNLNHQIGVALVNFCRQRNMTFEQNPIIAGKPQSTVYLFLGVLRMGGSKKIAATQQWAHVASLLQYPQQLQMQAGHELQAFWQRQLADFEVYWGHLQQQQFRQNQQQQAQQQQQQHIQQLQAQQRHANAEAMRNAAHAQNPNARPNHFPQMGAMSEQMGGTMQPPAKHAPNAAQVNGRPPSSNGINTGKPAPQPAVTVPLGRPNIDMMEHNQEGVRHKDLAAMGVKNEVSSNQNGKSSRSEERASCRQTSLPEIFTPSAFRPVLSALQKRADAADGAIPSKESKIVISQHGGLPIEDKYFQRSTESLLKYKLRGPLLLELGPIDIRALTLSIRSGIKGEIRHALDTLISLSEPQPGQMQAPLSLDQCEDLVQALAECALEQADQLASNASEVSDAIEIYSYEETLRACKHEANSLQECSPFGTLEWDLEHAAERLVCIVRIFREFAAFETSLRALADPAVAKMLATVIRQIGMRNMMLRTQHHTLEFCKHVVLFFSHMSQFVDFQSKEDAASVMHFLIAFAPLPEPHDDAEGLKSFSSYDPTLNQYLPYAVDAFAKLLTRDTNRKFYRSILTESTSLPNYDLLTRAFGLAISVIPPDDSITLINTLTHRIPFMTQGLLVAEILVGMIPNNEHLLAAAWLKSEDGFARRLLRTLRLFAQYLEQASFPPVHPQMQHRDMSDAYGHVMVTNRGLAFLKKLVTKAKEHPDVNYVLPDGIFPNVKLVLAALGNERIHPEISRQLCALADLSS